MLGTNTQALTYNLDDFSQQDSISHILLQVFDQSLVPRLCQVVIGPVRVNLLETDKPRLLLTLQMRAQRAGWLGSQPHTTANSTETQGFGHGLCYSAACHHSPASVTGQVTLSSCHGTAGMDTRLRGCSTAALSVHRAFPFTPKLVLFLSFSL